MRWEGSLFKGPSFGFAGEGGSLLPIMFYVDALREGRAGISTSGRARKNLDELFFRLDANLAVNVSCMGVYGAFRYDQRFRNV